MDIETLARLAKLYRESGHDKDVGRRLDAAVKEALDPQGPGLFDSLPCDHSWLPQVGGGWACEKCQAEMSLPPLGKAGAPEKPPPGTGGEP